MAAIQNADFAKHSAKLKVFVRTQKSVERIAEIEEEKVFIDRFCEHVENTLAQTQLNIEGTDIAQHQPKGGAEASFAHQSIIQTVNSFNSGKRRVKRSEGVQKIVHPICNLPAVLRQKITIGGSETVELDLKSSHIHLLLENGYLIGAEKAHFQALLATGDFWANLKAEIPSLSDVSRAEFKQLFWMALSKGKVFGRNAAIVEAIRNYIQENFMNLLCKVRLAEDFQGKKIQAILQILEAKKMDSFLASCISNEIPAIPVYDSIIVRKEDASFVVRFFGAEKISEKNANFDKTACNNK